MSGDYETLDVNQPKISYLKEFTIKQLTEEYCERLAQANKSYTDKMIEANGFKYVKNDNPDKYVIKEGRKYFGVWVSEYLEVNSCRKPPYKDGKWSKDGYYETSIHSFVNKENGEVLKPASWRSPAKGARYQLADEADRQRMYERLDPYGSYLYLKR